MVHDTAVEETKVGACKEARQEAIKRKVEVGDLHATGQARLEEAVRSKKKTRRCVTVKQEDRGKGEWQYYGSGRWSTFSPQASKWLEAALASGSGELSREAPSKKKSATQRRIRLVPWNACRLCETDAQQREWATSLQFYLVTASVLQRLHKM